MPPDLPSLLSAMDNDVFMALIIILATGCLGLNLNREEKPIVHNDDFFQTFSRIFMVLIIILATACLVL
jgi:hypothetical protein